MKRVQRANRSLADCCVQILHVAADFRVIPGAAHVKYGHDHNPFELIELRATCFSAVRTSRNSPNSEVRTPGCCECIRPTTTARDGGRTLSPAQRALDQLRHTTPLRFGRLIAPVNECRGHRIRDEPLGPYQDLQ